MDSAQLVFLVICAVTALTTMTSIIAVAKLRAAKSQWLAKESILNTTIEGTKNSFVTVQSKFHATEQENLSLKEELKEAQVIVNNLDADLKTSREETQQRLRELNACIDKCAEYEHDEELRNNFLNTLDLVVKRGKKGFIFRISHEGRILAQSPPGTFYQNSEEATGVVNALLGWVEVDIQEK